MKFDEMMVQTAKPQTADDILAGTEIIFTADDMNANDKAGFATGFLMGLTYCLQMSNEQRIPDAARALTRLCNEWSARDII